MFVFTHTHTTSPTHTQYTCMLAFTHTHTQPPLHTHTHTHTPHIFWKRASQDPSLRPEAWVRLGLIGVGSETWIPELRFSLSNGTSQWKSWQCLHPRGSALRPWQNASTQHSAECNGIPAAAGAVATYSDSNEHSLFRPSYPFPYRQHIAHICIQE